MAKTAERAALPTPTPDSIAAARQAAGLTQTAAASLVHLGSYVRWTEYEAGRRSIDSARWELFLLLTDQHPQLNCKRRRTTP